MRDVMSSDFGAWACIFVKSHMYMYVKIYYRYRPAPNTYVPVFRRHVCIVAVVAVVSPPRIRRSLARISLSPPLPLGRERAPFAGPARAPGYQPR